MLDFSTSPKQPQPAQTEINTTDIHLPPYAEVSVNTEILATTHLVTLTLWEQTIPTGQNHLFWSRSNSLLI